MPDLSATQIGFIHDLMQRVGPSVGAALSDQLNCEASLTLLAVQPVSLTELLSRSESTVQTQFTLTRPEGSDSVFMLDEASARVLVNLMEGKSPSASPEALTDAHIDTLSAGMNGLVRAFAAALGGATGESYDLESSSTHLGPLTVPPVFALEGSAIEVRFALSVPDFLTAEMMALFTTTLMLELMPPPDGQPFAAPFPDAGSGLGEDDVAAMLGQAVGGGGDFGPRVSPAFPLGIGADSGGSSPFANLISGNGDAALPRGLDMILDIPLDVTVELGRVRMLIKDVLELSSGSIIELDRVAGEPVDLLVNGRLVAKGEVVVIEDNFGIRITEITSPADRVAGLGKGR